MSFGRRLREARLARDMKQAELAEAAGLHFTAISHYENNRHEPRLAGLIALIEVLEVSADWLLLGDE